MRNLLSKLLLLAATVGFAASPALAADAPKAAAPAANASKAGAEKPQAPQMQMPFFTMPHVPKKDIEPNTVSESISKEAKTKAIQSMMMANPLSIRDMMNLMTFKVKAKPGISFDDVVTSMKLRANFHNYKYVGHSPLSKDVEAVTGKPSPRVEVFSFCDSVVARRLLDYAPELIAFLPCRIAVLEDAKKDIWLITIDWDISWVDYSQNPNKMDADLYKESRRIRDVMEDMMHAGANGDL
jgi:uncharacterized protein (DUF302 family)